MVYEFCSTSKVSFPGAGISAVAASSANLIDLRKVWKFATIGPDKLNQLRQARFFRNESGIEAHMARHARLLRPKFEQVISIFREELDGSGIASWTEPRGGYFLSFDTMAGCAARTVELCRRGESPDDPYSGMGILRVDVGSAWEKSDVLAAVIAALLPDAYALLNCRTLMTKAAPYAVARVATLTECGFVRSDKPVMGHHGERFEYYWVREK